MTETPLHLVRELADFEAEFQRDGYSAGLQKRFYAWQRTRFFPWEGRLSRAQQRELEITESIQWLSRRMHFAQEGLRVEIVNQNADSEIVERLKTASHVEFSMLGDGDSNVWVAAWKPKPSPQ